MHVYQRLCSLYQTEVRLGQLTISALLLLRNCYCRFTGQPARNLELLCTSRTALASLLASWSAISPQLFQRVRETERVSSFETQKKLGHTFLSSPDRCTPNDTLFHSINSFDFRPINTINIKYSFDVRLVDQSGSPPDLVMADRVAVSLLAVLGRVGLGGGGY